MHLRSVGLVHRSFAWAYTGPNRSVPMTKRVILLIDDEAKALELRKLVLERAGYSVLTTTKGDKALQIIRSQAVDLVISDHLLIGASGTELAGRIKETNPGVPVMLLSGVNELPEGVEKADLFVSKTEGPSALLEKVAALLA